MDPQLGIHDGQRVTAHLAGANSVVGRERHRTDIVTYCGLALHLWSRVQFLPPKGSEGLRLRYFAAQADPLDQRLQVRRAGQVAGLDGRRLERVGRAQGDETTTLRVERGEPDREAMASSGERRPPRRHWR